MTVLQVLLDSLAENSDNTAQDMAHAIQRDFPHYRDFPDDEAEGSWHDGLRSILVLFADVAKTGRRLSAEERGRIVVIGETRADQGVPLDVVLGSVRLAMHVALSAVRHHACELRDLFPIEDAIDEISLLMTRFVNDFSTEISRGYVARSEARATSLERERAQFGSDLLAGVHATYADARRTGEAIGLVVPSTLGLFVVPASGPVHTLLVADLRRAVQAAIVVPIGSTPPHTALIVPSPTVGEWTDATKKVGDVLGRHHVTALGAGPSEGPEQWHARYTEAVASLGLAPTFAEGRSLLDVDELVPAQIVAAGPSTALHAIEREVLAPLRRHSKGKKLLRALDAFLRTDGSPKAAARLLGVAVTTARTYKATIEETTRLCFDRPADAMRLGIGWLLLRHHGGTAITGP